MKFLCIECNEAMKISSTSGPEEGSMSVVFGCPKCGKEIGMLTNPMETQMVRSLNITIGSNAESTEPMQMVRKNLKNQRETIFKNDKSGDSSNSENQEKTESKCPFSDVVASAMENGDKQLIWTEEAEKRLERIPSFVRSMARKGIEQYALENGFDEIDDSVMDKVKDKYGM
jgi:hypothetical protein